MQRMPCPPSIKPDVDAPQMQKIAASAQNCQHLASGQDGECPLNADRCGVTLCPDAGTSRMTAKAAASTTTAAAWNAMRQPSASTARDPSSSPAADPRNCIDVRRPKRVPQCAALPRLPTIAPRIDALKAPLKATPTPRPEQGARATSRASLMQAIPRGGPDWRTAAIERPIVQGHAPPAATQMQRRRCRA